MHVDAPASLSLCTLWVFIKPILQICCKSPVLSFIQGNNSGMTASRIPHLLEGGTHAPDSIYADYILFPALKCFFHVSFVVFQASFEHYKDKIFTKDDSLCTDSA